MAAGGANEVQVWPENWPAFELFARMQTQWSVGFGGRTGLRYEALYPLLDRMGLSHEDWDEALEDVRVMEIAALTQMSEDSSDNG